MPYIIAAYVTAGAGIGGLLLHSFVAMRRAERQADDMRAKKPEKEVQA